jgi:hypothetical protein
MGYNRLTAGLSPELLPGSKMAVSVPLSYINHMVDFCSKQLFGASLNHYFYHRYHFPDGPPESGTCITIRIKIIMIARFCKACVIYMIKMKALSHKALNKFNIRVDFARFAKARDSALEDRFNESNTRIKHE